MQRYGARKSHDHGRTFVSSLAKTPNEFQAMALRLVDIYQDDVVMKLQQEQVRFVVRILDLEMNIRQF